MIRKPSALAVRLTCNPCPPTVLATLLSGDSSLAQFRTVVKLVLPDDLEEIMGAPPNGCGGRETARVWAFCRRMEAERFPIHELEEYEQVTWCISFVKYGWNADDFHELGSRDLEHNLLFALCEQPWPPEMDSRLPLLDEVAKHLPPELIRRIPREGFSPEQLHAQLDGTRFEVAASYADWLWAETDNIFLDSSDEMSEGDPDWTAEAVNVLSEHWAAARSFFEELDRCSAWLAESRAAHFAELLDAIGPLQPELLSHQEHPHDENTHVIDRGRPATRRRRSSPFDFALPKELEGEEDPLRLRMDFHSEITRVTDFGLPFSETWTVSARDVAHALARELDLNSGLLPPSTLWWAKTAGGTYVAIWRGPKMWTARIRRSLDEPPRAYRIPMPGLVFVCTPEPQGVYVFAAKARPRSADDQLYHCPTPNIYDSGGVCVGSHHFPHDPARIPEAFFESYFSVNHLAQGKSQSHPHDVTELWPELRRQKTYPLDDLVPHLLVGDAFRMGDA